MNIIPNKKLLLTTMVITYDDTLHFYPKMGRNTRANTPIKQS